MSRVYDDPNHACYGPVRRLWVVLVALWDDLDALDENYRARYGKDWDQEVVEQMAAASRWNERQIARVIVWQSMKAVCDL